jgi:hypothetical protein
MIEFIITLFVITAVGLLLLGFALITASLSGFEFRLGLGELPFRPKRRADPSSYWGRYVREQKESVDTATGIDLSKFANRPKLGSVWDEDWTDGPPSEP